MPVLNDANELRMGTRVVRATYVGPTKVWPTKSYLVPSIGGVNTPDAGALPLRATMIAKLRPSGTLVSSGTTDYIAGQITPNTWRSCFLNGLFYQQISNGSTFRPGTNLANTAQLTSAGLATQTDLHFTSMFDHDNGANAIVMRVRVSHDDGTTWTDVSPAFTQAPSIPVPVTSTANVFVSTIRTPQIFTRIYWCELRSGLDPSGQAAAGATLELPGVVGNFLSTPHTAAYQITGDLEITARFVPPAVDSSIVSRWNPSGGGTLGGRGFMFSIFGRYPRLSVSTTGNDYPFAASTGALTAGQSIWVKTTRVAATGAVNFYTAPDSPNEPTTWTLLGAADRPTTAGNIFAATPQIEIGSYNNGKIYPYTGKIMQAIIRNGIGGTVVFHYDERLIPNDLVTTFGARGGQVITVNQSESNKILKPVASELIWRFDASEYPGSGTSYTDPRGRVWTLTNANAIKRG